MNSLSSSYLPCKTKALALSLALLTSAAHGEAIFDFNNGTAFDNVNIGPSMTVVAGANLIWATPLFPALRSGSTTAPGVAGESKLLAVAA
jgi:hypothetical protein